MQYIESMQGGLPGVQQSGLNTKKNVDFSGSSSVKLPSTGLVVSSIIPSVNEYVGFTALAATNFAASTNYPIYIVPNDGFTWKVTAISYRFSAQAASAATFSVEVTPSGTAMGSGTAQTGNLSLQGTTNTVINGTLTAHTTLNAGDQVTFVVASTATTSLANFEATVALTRVS